MKCQKCEKFATFHITELTSGKPVEFHFCEEHAREYLSESSDQNEAATTLAESLAQNAALNHAVENLHEIDQQVCPVCGISFFEFRSKGRLGCPFDYTCFNEQLGMLVENIHGERRHIGKIPNSFNKGQDRRTHLIKLRRELDEAIAIEDYENAKTLRDQIREIEGNNLP
ncbi:MAG: UvrB/UvrC motif-containing protein [Planctomycetaceae bacterium]|jgi:protein arginine kinase activator|nr:UvrB/UvrC motif-containing protein [Planctomycetaceae bacterium]